MKKVYANCRCCGRFLKDEEIRESPEFYKNEENVWYCDECVKIRVSENVLSDDLLRALRKARQEIVRKKWLEDGITDTEEEELNVLTRRLRLHWRASDPPMPHGYRYPPFWTKCSICEAEMKTEDEYRVHWKVCPIRSLDNEIAEKAMGWALDEDELGNRYWCGSHYNYDRNGIGEHQGPDGFEPAKNMRHTHWVMEKLEKEGWEFEITSRSGEKAIRVKDPAGGSSGWLQYSGIGLPEAVCRAIIEVFRLRA